MRRAPFSTVYNLHRLVVYFVTRRNGKFFICFDRRLWPSNKYIQYDLFFPQGIDIDHRRGHKAKRTAPKSKDVYLLLLVKVRTQQCTKFDSFQTTLTIINVVLSFFHHCLVVPLLGSSYSVTFQQNNFETSVHVPHQPSADFVERHLQIHGQDC